MTPRPPPSDRPRRPKPETARARRALRAWAGPRPRWRSALARSVLLPLALAACTQRADETAPDSARSAADATDTAPPGIASPTVAAPAALAPSGRPYSEAREACTHRDPRRQVFWGELHVHSALSMDAWLWDTRGGPDEVYRFGRGEEVLLPPLDERGRGTRPVRLERPLDFVALTDHADFQGEVALCIRPDSPAFDTPLCRQYRGEDPDAPERNARIGLLSRALHPDPDDGSLRSDLLCGADGALCREAMTTVWKEQQAAAERHYDRSAECRFTTFHAWEYTATPDLAKVHHNVIFRNANVPEMPITWTDVPDVYDMWSRLERECLAAGNGCDVITLPHNSNLSNGNMFAVTGRDLPLETQRARAQLRGDIERLAEITQIKGDSECRNGMWNVLGASDELCDYEQWRGPEYEDCRDGTGKGALFDQGCVGRSDFLRYALLEGFREQARIGVNPYKLGFIAATDTHNATPGDVEEYSYDGWAGTADATPALRLTKPEAAVTLTWPARSNPGGLAGVFAEENSRDALFDAMERRETFATSGPRMTARFFGGWALPADLCARPDLVEQGYAAGVPMGGDLPPRPDGATSPSFAVSALRDPGAPGHPGGLLQRVQIVKGWVDAQDRLHQAVYDVAGGPNDASVDPATCEPRGTGHESLCQVWTDPDFDPATSAVYYVRVLENPSCRWTARQCLALPADRRPPECSDPVIPTTIQERLWTSPIWYEAAVR